MTDLSVKLSMKIRYKIVDYFKNKEILNEKDKLSLKYLIFNLRVFNIIKNKSIEDQEIYITNLLEQLFDKLKYDNIYDKFKSFKKKKYKILKILKIKLKNKLNIINNLNDRLKDEIKNYRNMISKKYYQSLTPNAIKRRNQKYIQNLKNKIGINNYYLKTRFYYNSWYKNLPIEKKKLMARKKYLSKILSNK